MPRQLAAIGHMVDLSAYANGVVRKVIRLLNSVDADLFKELTAALQGMGTTEFNLQRLETLLASVRALNANAYARVGDVLQVEMLGLTQAEIEFSQRMVAGAETLSAVSPEQAFSAATRQPIRGRLMSDWSNALGTTRAGRIQRALAIAYTEGRTIPEMVSRLRGTRAAGYADGLLNADRRELETLARTITSHFAASAREQVFAQNSKVIKAVVWASTLDTRTSEICQIRDGAQYTPDGKPIGHALPWLGGPGRAHWNCRSASYPVLADIGIDLSKGRQRASMDGPVSGNVTFAQWIAKQSKARQTEVLGATRAKLMREGKMKLGDFYTNKGRFLTLDQLRAKDATTFQELGL